MKSELAQASMIFHAKASASTIDSPDSHQAEQVYTVVIHEAVFDFIDNIISLYHNRIYYNQENMIIS